MKDFDINNLKFFKGEGCGRCANTGYSGRVAIAEGLQAGDRVILNREVAAGARVRARQ